MERRDKGGIDGPPHTHTQEGKWRKGSSRVRAQSVTDTQRRVFSNLRLGKGVVHRSTGKGPQATVLRLGLATGGQRAVKEQALAYQKRGARHMCRDAGFFFF